MISRTKKRSSAFLSPHLGSGLSVRKRDMGLSPLLIDPWEGAVPDRARQIIDSAQECLESFHVRYHKQPVPGFYPSDFELVYRTFAAIDERRHHKSSQGIGLSFCEWGAGIPVVSALTTLFEWKPLAVECDRKLVEAARSWMQSERLEFELRHASFIPEAYIDEVHQHESLQGIVAKPLDVPALDVEDLQADIVYAYPWPGEAEVMESLFRLVARPGDLLVTFHGSFDLRIQRLVSSS